MTDQNPFQKLQAEFASLTPYQRAALGQKATDLHWNVDENGALASIAIDRNESEVNQNLTDAELEGARKLVKEVSRLRSPLEQVVETFKHISEKKRQASYDLGNGISAQFVQENNGVTLKLERKTDDGVTPVEPTDELIAALQTELDKNVEVGNRFAGKKARAEYQENAKPILIVGGILGLGKALLDGLANNPLVSLATTVGAGLLALNFTGKIASEKAGKGTEHEFFKTLGDDAKLSERVGNWVRGSMDALKESMSGLDGLKYYLHGQQQAAPQR